MQSVIVIIGKYVGKRGMDMLQTEIKLFYR